MKQKKQNACRNIEVHGNQYGLTLKVNDQALIYRLEKVAQRRGETVQSAFEAKIAEYLATH